MIVRLLLFLFLNFGALAMGSFFTRPGVASEWYVQLDKAPWTPPGWIFGAAWTIIMISFSFYMALAYEKVKNRKLLLSLFAFQFVLNILWNPVFFYFQRTALALILIVSLWVIVQQLMFRFQRVVEKWKWLVLPYYIWLLIAISLNTYIVFQN
ncbi:MAG: TspO/MBR family protein [Bacteroidota bacterium]